MDTRLLLQPSEECINTTFICCVSNTMGTAQVAMSVLLPCEKSIGNTDTSGGSPAGSPLKVPGPSREQSWSLSALMIISPIVGFVATVLGALINFHCFRKSRHDPQETLENEASALCLQVENTTDSYTVEMETDAKTVTETVMVTERGTETGTKVEIEPKHETENPVEIVEQRWKQHDRLFGQIEVATEWKPKKAEAGDESGIDEKQSSVDHDWDSEPPSDDPAKLMTQKTLKTLELPRFTGKCYSFPNSCTKDEIRLRKRKMHQLSSETRDKVTWAARFSQPGHAEAQWARESPTTMQAQSLGGTSKPRGCKVLPKVGSPGMNGTKECRVPGPHRLQRSSLHELRIIRSWVHSKSSHRASTHEPQHVLSLPPPLSLL